MRLPIIARVPRYVRAIIDTISLALDPREAPCLACRQTAGPNHDCDVARFGAMRGERLTLGEGAT